MRNQTRYGKEGECLDRFTKDSKAGHKTGEALEVITRTVKPNTAKWNPIPLKAERSSNRQGKRTDLVKNLPPNFQDAGTDRDKAGERKMPVRRGRSRKHFCLLD